MRILICNFEYPPLGGGGGIFTAQLAAELALRHDVAILTSRCAGLPAEERDGRLEVFRLHVPFRREKARASFLSLAWYALFARRTARRIFQRQPPEIVNSHFAIPSGLVGASLSGRWNLPHVVTCLGGDIYDPSKFLSPHRHRFLRSKVRRILTTAAGVVADSCDIQSRIRNLYGLEAILIPLGIRPPVRCTASRSELGLPEDELVLISVGRLVKRKALDRLLRVVADLKDLCLCLVVVGTGPAERRLRRVAERCKLGNRVVFTGYVNGRQKAALLSAADLYVSTSQHEGFGLVFLEAMAAGLPVVCYDRGGQRDFLQDGLTGFLVPLNDEHTFKARLRHLAADTALRRRMAGENKRRFRKYHIADCAWQYEELFRGLLAQRRAKAWAPYRG